MIPAEAREFLSNVTKAYGLKVGTFCAGRISGATDVRALSGMALLDEALTTLEAKQTEEADKLAKLPFNG